jgi:hypothetical protein
MICGMKNEMRNTPRTQPISRITFKSKAPYPCSDACEAAQ